MGYQFEGRDHREARSGSCQSQCESDLNQGLIQCVAPKSKEEHFPADGANYLSRGCADSEDGAVPGMEISNTDCNGPYSMQNEPNRVLIKAEDVVSTTKIHKSLGDQAYGKACTSLSSVCTVQSSCGFTGDGNGSVAGDAEADRMELEGGVEVVVGL